MAEAESISSSTESRQKVNEFNDGRKRPHFTYKESFNDWFKQSFSKNFSDKEVEQRLLSYLPFFPESDGTRTAKLVDTKLDDGNYIHEFCVENISDTSSKEILPSEQPVKDVVLVHGYAASLGLFIDNFDSLSKIPGIKIHAIDLLGFGMSSRPKFPKFGDSTKEDIYKIEDWFIDSIEEWRIKRNIDRFVLIGHSFGGYLSCAYVRKYNKSIIDASTKKTLNLVDKLVLISPVGVEKSKFSLLGKAEPNLNPQVSINEELEADQEEIVRDEYKPEEESTSRRSRIITYLWGQHISPFSIVRNAGPFKSKMISRWTTHRFSHVYYENRQHFYNIHDYLYRVFNGGGSGEFAITRVLAVGALARLPLIERMPEKLVQMNLPTLWLYGDKDWMNDEAGAEMCENINALSKQKYNTKLAQFSYIQNAGHHVYLDNPPQFANTLFKFLGFRK